MVQRATPRTFTAASGALGKTVASALRPKVLLTGFDAFGGDAINPSWLAAKALHGRVILGHTVTAAQLPTVFGESVQMLRTLLRQHKPMLTICIGQAGGRTAISLERVAINVNDARIADNAGARPVDCPVVPGAPAACFSTLPIKAMLLALQREDIPAEVSQTAGTFVCNHVFYGLMHLLANERGFKRSRGGFIHVPWLPEQGTPSMPLADITRGIKLAVRTALATHTDAVVGAGSLD
jgi:pyroglutamyl-peptidase